MTRASALNFGRKQMECKAVYFTNNGRLLAEKMQKCGVSLSAFDGRGGQYRCFVENCFQKGERLIFIGAMGIAVRAIAPYIRSKDTDPAVLVMDEKGQFVIPLLSGHIGGANRLAQYIAEVLGAQAVLTTATDIHGVFAADDWAAKNGMTVKNIGHIKGVSSKLLGNECVALETDEAKEAALPQGLYLAKPGEIYIGSDMKKGQDKLHLVPKCCVLGLGCRKGSRLEDIETLFSDVCKLVCKDAFYAVASIDLKKDEPGILAFCKKHALAFYTFSAAELQAVPGAFTASAFVKQTTGVDNVCERSAARMTGRVHLPKISKNGVTMAVGQKVLELNFE